MSFDHSRYRAHLLRQSLVANGLRGRAARMRAADAEARLALGDRYAETSAKSAASAA